MRIFNKQFKISIKAERNNSDQYHFLEIDKKNALTTYTKITEFFR